MSKGFMQFSDRELAQLAGRLVGIDLQSGCPHQCYGCGTDAQPFGESMDWEVFLTISRSIAETKKRGFDLWSSFYDATPFRGSDPVFYHSIDSEGNERTIWDVIQELWEVHEHKSLLATSGWTPGNTYMQRAIDKIVENPSESHLTEIHYAVKGFGSLVRADYLTFLKRNGFIDDVQNIDGVVLDEEQLYDKMDDFCEHSKYAQQVISNLNSLSGFRCNPSIQYLDVDGRKNLPSKNKIFSFLFGSRFIRKLRGYVNSKLNKKTIFGERLWAGIGRAQDDLGLLQSVDLNENQFIIENPGHNYERVNPSRYHLFIKHDCTIDLYYGKHGHYSSVLVPAEFLEKGSSPDKQSNQELYNRHQVLSQIQGRNILKPTPKKEELVLT